jgi:hypothetical protein
MGGAATHLGFSPLTFNTTFGMGGHVHNAYSGLVGGASDYIGSSGSVISLIPQSDVPTSLDLSLSTLDPSPAMPSPPATIKDEPADMGFNDITNKDSWTNAKKVINACHRCTPYWPRPSKELITTTSNAATSAWWEEVIFYHCKPPIFRFICQRIAV